MEPSHNSVIRSCMLLMSNCDLRDKAIRAEPRRSSSWGPTSNPRRFNDTGSGDREPWCAMDKLWLKPSILKPYWLGHDLKLVLSIPPLVFPWPEEIGQPPRGPSRVSFIVSLVLLDLRAPCHLFGCQVFSCLA